MDKPLNHNIIFIIIIINYIRRVVSQFTSLNVFKRFDDYCKLKRISNIDLIIKTSRQIREKKNQFFLFFIH